MTEIKIALGMRLTKLEMHQLGVDIDCLNDIQDFLWDHFCAISQTAVIGKFIPNISWSHRPADISDKDLVVYFVRNPSNGIIKDLGMTIPQDGGGLTVLNAPGKGAISEVYVE